MKSHDGNKKRQRSRRPNDWVEGEELQRLLEHYFDLECEKDDILCFELATRQKKTFVEPLRSHLNDYA